jgi:FKBP-type peptidyl-prolyl cis-trans isomerase FkpA
MKKTTFPILMLLAVLAAFATGCNTGYKKTKGGFKYAFRKDAKGPTAREGQFVKFYFRQFIGDTMDRENYSMSPAFYPVVKPGARYDLNEVFKLMSEGDSITVVAPVDSLFKDQGNRPPYAKKGAQFRLEIKVLKVFDKREDVEADFKKEQATYAARQIAVDYKEIEPYMAKNNLKGTKTTGGTFVVIDREGTGPTPVTGQTVSVNYTGRLLTTGVGFDSNTDSTIQKDKSRLGKPFSFPINVGAGLVKGWEEGLMLMKKGSKGRLIIPSSQGWGQQGSPPAIPANANVIFEIEVLDIKETPKEQMPIPAMPIEGNPQQNNQEPPKEEPKNEAPKKNN